MAFVGLRGGLTVSREGAVGEPVPTWGAPSTLAPQTRPHSGLTRGSVCSACRPFSLSDLDDYEKHFTVMNYDPEVVLKQVGGLEGPGGAWGAGSRRPRPHTRKLVFWAGSVDRQRPLAPVLSQTARLPQRTQQPRKSRFAEQGASSRSTDGDAEARSKSVCLGSLSEIQGADPASRLPFMS